MRWQMDSGMAASQWRPRFRPPASNAPAETCTCVMYRWQSGLCLALYPPLLFTGQTRHRQGVSTTRGFQQQRGEEQPLVQVMVRCEKRRGVPPTRGPWTRREYPPFSEELLNASKKMP